jgi:hypothetical protein
MQRLDRFRSYEILAARIVQRERAVHGGSRKVLTVGVLSSTLEAAGLPERQFTKSLEWNLNYLSGRPALVTMVAEKALKHGQLDYVIQEADPSAPASSVAAIDGKRYRIRGTP